MPRTQHRKRAFLFLAAVLLPSAVLVGTTVHLIRQERELAIRRAGEEKTLLALQAGRALFEELRRLGGRIEAVNLTPGDLIRLADSETGLLALAVSSDNALSFPWEMASPSPTTLSQGISSEYARLIQMGSEAEHRRGNLVRAAELYGQAADLVGEQIAVSLPMERGEETAPNGSHALVAEARLSQARAFLRANRGEEARGIFLQLSETPAFLMDQNGMPFFLYGIDGLMKCGAPPGDLGDMLALLLEKVDHLSFTGLLASKELAEEMTRTEAVEGEAGMAPGRPNQGLLQELEEATDDRAAVLEALDGFRNDFPALKAQARGVHDPLGGAKEPQWLPYGSTPWLIGFLPSARVNPTRVAVVEPAGLMEAGMELLAAGDTGGESLGSDLNGLRTSFSPELFPQPEAGSVEGWFIRLLLPVILVLTGFTAFLAWRDVRRETEAVRLRSQFVSSVTHELKTPLTSIRMFAETLRLGRHSGPEALGEYLDTMVHETERLSRLINNVLDFARIERGEKTYHLALIDVGAAAREAARAVAYPLSQGKYELVTEIPDDLPMIDADSDALTQALLNLLSNAIKFSPEESRIDLRVLRKGEDLLFQVQDRGRGIARHERESIFRDFYRTPDAEEDGVPGTGLGLSLVAHVAKAHEGGIEVESEIGEGSTFTLRIPISGSLTEPGTGASPSSPTLDPSTRTTP